MQALCYDRAVDPERIRALLAGVASGDTSVESALNALADLPFADLGDARLDHHRQLRTGMPEVVYAEGKTDDQLIRLLQAIIDRGQTALATRVSRDQALAVTAGIDGVVHNPAARTLLRPAPDAPEPSGRTVCIVSAGTSDQPVAEEAAVTASALGHPVDRIYDVGVSGLHRVASVRARLQAAGAIIVVAGMEGALASVVGGLVSRPVIAVPTSVGYGASFGGIAALLGMLNGCASGVTVVNIDNGFGAASAASRILHGGAADGA